MSHSYWQRLLGPFSAGFAPEADRSSYQAPIVSGVLGGRARFRRLLVLTLGLSLAVVVACESAPRNDPKPSAIAPGGLTAPALNITPQVISTPGVSTQSTVNSIPPPAPTPEPTIRADAISTADWQRFGTNTGILEILAPPEWVDISGLMDVPSSVNQLGLTVLLMADTEKSGKSILAGKELTAGAIVVGIITDLDWPSDDPVGALSQIFADLDPSVTVTGDSDPAELSIPQSLSTSPLSSDGLLAAMFDTVGDPAGYFSSDGGNILNRVLLFPLDMAEDKPGEDVLAGFLFGAPRELWPHFEPTFQRMMATINISANKTGFALNGGATRVLGSLSDEGRVTGKLEKGIRDVWTFRADGGQYGTFRLRPTDRDIDLAITVIDPYGQVVAVIDGGYVGVTETAVDIALSEDGRYVVEIAEFFGGSGRYSLDLALTDSPTLGNAGEIKPGESIQSELSENARHVWDFSGTAGQFVTIVLVPVDDRLDAILHLYDPEGNRLAALDEGFSGDAEVISGYELPVTGEYSIQVRSFAGNGGIYTLSLDDGGEEIHNFLDAGDLIDGDVKRETLRIDEAHAWFFEGRVGDVVDVEVIPLDQHLDLDLWLLDPSINRITAEDRAAAGAPETIQSTIEQDGQYLIFVRDFQGNSGSYEVRFALTNENAPEDVGELVYGEPVTVTLNVGQSVVWRFWGDVDDIVDVRLIPLNTEADLLFQLQDPEANTIVEEDKGVAGEEEALLGFTIADEGPWRIVVREFFGEAASYMLSVRRSQR